MPKTVGNLKLYMGPADVGGPDNLQDAITEFISQATKSLDIAVQELDSETIARAIIKKRPGVRVRLVMEAKYLKANRARPIPGMKGEVMSSIARYRTPCCARLPGSGPILIPRSSTRSSSFATTTRS